MANKYTKAQKKRYKRFGKKMFNIRMKLIEERSGIMPYMKWLSQEQAKKDNLVESRQRIKNHKQRRLELYGINSISKKYKIWDDQETKKSLSLLIYG